MPPGASSKQAAPPIRPITTASADHYLWGEGCDGWHLVREAGLSVIEERMAPGTTEARHWHARSRQFFYVLRGTLALEVDGVIHVVAARSGIHVPPGVPHQARHSGEGPVEFLVISEPPHHRDRQPA